MFDWIEWPGGEWRTQRMIEECGSGAVYEIQRGMEKALMKVICIPADPSETEFRQQEGMSQSIAHFAEQAEKAVQKLERLKKLKDCEHLLIYDEYKVLKDPEGRGWRILLRSPFLDSAKKWFEEHFYDEKMFLHFCVDVFDAVKVCHAAGILHGNIAPENVFLNDNGDFLLGGFEIDPWRENNRPIECRPPEADRGDAYSASEELYAVGLLFYKLLNRMRGPFMPMYGLPMPWDAEKAAEDLRSGRKIPDPVYGSREIREAVLKSIAFRPEDRFADLKEFQSALGAWEAEKNDREEASSENLAEKREDRFRDIDVQELKKTNTYEEAADTGMKSSDREDAENGEKPYHDGKRMEPYQSENVEMVYTEPKRLRRKRASEEDLYREQESRWEGGKKAEEVIERAEAREKNVEFPEEASKVREEINRVWKLCVRGIHYVLLMLLKYVKMNEKGFRKIFGGVAAYLCSIPILFIMAALMATLHAVEDHTETPGARPAVTEVPVTVESSKNVELERAGIGEYVAFGKYEQDNRMENGKEAIEWIVLDKAEDEIRLISRNILEYMPYDEGKAEESADWENSTLRKWLNTEFFDQAFDEADKSILKSTEDNDHVFLLSALEADTDFGWYDTDKNGSVFGASSGLLKGMPTQYARKQLTGTAKDTESQWWLKSAGECDGCAAIVNEYKIDRMGEKVGTDFIGVRPVVCIDQKLLAESIADAKEKKLCSLFKESHEKDIVRFGSYEQDGRAKNGREEIEWMVLSKKKHDAVLISRYILDIQPYHRVYQSVTWEESTLREWLLTDFMECAFDPAEKRLLQSETVQDPIYIIGEFEYNHYSYWNFKGRTSNVIKQNVDSSDSWWLRTDKNADAKAWVVTKGYMDQIDKRVDEENIGVRPVVRIHF